MVFVFCVLFGTWYDFLFCFGVLFCVLFGVLFCVALSWCRFSFQ